MGSRLDVEHAVQIAVVSQHAEGDPAPVVGSVRSPLGPLGIDHREQLRAGATDDRRVEAAGKIQRFVVRCARPAPSVQRLGGVRR